MPQLIAIQDLGQRRMALARHLDAVGAEGFADDLEPLLVRAAEGHRNARDASLALASWVAHGLADTGRSPLAFVGEAAVARGLPLAGALFTEAPAHAALARRGRLAEVGIARFHDLAFGPSRRDPSMPVSEWRSLVAFCRNHYARRVGGRAFSELERFRAHHDPAFIARLLDATWLLPRHVVVIASRRPTTPAITLAVATRDRWFSNGGVQAALVANPFTPMSLVGALLPAANEAELVAIAARRASAAQRAAAQVLAVRRCGSPSSA